MAKRAQKIKRTAKVRKVRTPKKAVRTEYVSAADMPRDTYGGFFG